MLSKMRSVTLYFCKYFFSCSFWLIHATLSTNHNFILVLILHTFVCTANYIVLHYLPHFNTNVVNDSKFVVNCHGDYFHRYKNRHRRINPTVPALSPSYFTTEHITFFMIITCSIILLYKLLNNLSSKTMWFLVLLTCMKLFIII